MQPCTAFRSRLAAWPRQLDPIHVALCHLGNPIDTIIPLLWLSIQGLAWPLTSIHAGNPPPLPLLLGLNMFHLLGHAVDELVTTLVGLGAFSLWMGERCADLES